VAPRSHATRAACHGHAHAAFAGRALSVNQEVYESEAATNPRNLAAAESTYVHDHRVETANVELIATFVATVLFYSLVSKRIERTVLTAPMLFTAAGAAALAATLGSERAS